LKQAIKQEQLAENILAGYGLRSNDRYHKPNLEEINLELFINDYFRQHAILLTDAKLTLQTGGAANSNQTPMVSADSNLLKVILDNIVDNALRYCSPGLELTVSVFYRDKKAIISIRDNGPGLHPIDSEKIFNAFKHLKNELPGKLHGSGMGLYISRRLAELMLGQLELYRENSDQKTGKGAEFRVYLTISKTSRRAIKKNEI
jgi:signal transduction histidine kinase